MPYPHLGLHGYDYINIMHRDLFPIRLLIEIVNWQPYAYSNRLRQIARFHFEEKFRPSSFKYQIRSVS